MCGCLSLPASEASFWNCERYTVPNSGSRNTSGSMVFNATSRPEKVSRARYTVPVAPLPSILCTSYLPTCRLRPRSMVSGTAALPPVCIRSGMLLHAALAERAPRHQNRLLRLSGHGARMAHREVPVESLEFGMFVAKLDRPWTETPFVYQGFVLKTEQQLEALKKYCKRVYVDPEKRQEPVAARLLTLPPGSARRAIAEQSRERVRGSVVSRELAAVEDELPRARSVFTQTNAIVHTLSRAVTTGNALDGDRAKQAVHEITDSVVRNPDA